MIRFKLRIDQRRSMLFRKILYKVIVVEPLYYVCNVSVFYDEWCTANSCNYGHLSEILNKDYLSTPSVARFSLRY